MKNLRPVPTAEPTDVIESWIHHANAAIAQFDGSRFARLFHEDGYWRDLLSLTWDFKTFAGRQEIATAFALTSPQMKLGRLSIDPHRAAPCHVRRSGLSLVEAYLTFETAFGVGAAFVRLSYDPSAPNASHAWQLVTTLHHLHGFAEKVDADRPTGEKYSKLTSAQSWRQRRTAEESYDDRDPEVIVIGAGQSGLMLAARLRQMGVDVLVVERLAQVGDVWRQRYNNLTLHNELTANHFPYMPFPSNWPIWLPKDMLADWLEAYAKFQELNVWTGTELVGSSFDSERKVWEVTLRRPDGSERKLSPRHLVAAMGISGGAPRRPMIKGLSEFEGTVLHSAEFTSGADWVGKRALVIGTGNSGHDIAQDLYVAGASDVRLLQRGATCVVSLDPSAMISYSVYGEGRSVEDADLMVAAIPYPVLIDTYRWITQRTNELDRDLLSRLEAIGFKTTTGEDETGFQLLYLRGRGGYYIDVGCSELLIEKKIGLLQSEDTEGFDADGLRMKNGSSMPFDLVVLATGFETMEASIRRLLGDEVADRVGPVWGFDEDQTMRNMWKRTGQENFWIMGGAIIEARLFSRFLALQIKASLEGLLPAPENMPLLQNKAFERTAT
ncbi:cation diffusion facilitator CzcD-associated flavoprotein CzcO [Rhodoligotrophos appendicifer]|uniref:flavin-containing monooxygenase n=1 Tax=Rhodoligotrophos appendicifer TaxID=987056 RepID=UPI00118720CC|nr:NAD(P)/FAD-dependent oxidoreductase [Rhodoligotrophos appendicifer]